ncbi:MAG: CRTAC1 family protein [Candidatus Krumholzibacteria bacterium]
MCVAATDTAIAVTPSFTDVAGESGVRFRHTFGADKLESILMTTGSGCAMFDYDNDGWLDAFLVNGTYLDKQGRPLPNKPAYHALFHNRGDGSFENVTEDAGLNVPSYGQGCACADYDGDGFTDLYITNYGPNQLYRNNGDGTFEDVTERSGTGDPRWGGGAVFFDYDGDGDLDLFVANYVKYRPDMKGVHASSFSKRTGFRFFPGPRDYEAEEDILYRNNGDGTFTDVSEEMGLVSGGKGLTVVAVDLDNDGDQDVFVANDATPNFFYRNDGARFAEIALQAGIAYDPDGAETAAMGVDVADVDGDGLMDLYVTNMIFEFNNMYRNQGDLIFEDASRDLGLDKDNYRHVGWATRFVDFNHDGYLDCFVANGHVVDYIEGFSQSITYPQQNMLFVGNENARFENVADDSGKCFKRKRVSRGGAFGDYDNDGDIDILISNSGGRAELLRNDLPANDRWIKVRLSGHPPNTHGIGAKVLVRFGDRVISSGVCFASSYLSSSDPTVHVGLPAGITSGTVEIIWPSGKRSIREVRAGTLIVIEEPAEPNTSE